MANYLCLIRSKTPEPAAAQAHRRSSEHSVSANARLRIRPPSARSQSPFSRGSALTGPAPGSTFSSRRARARPRLRFWVVASRPLRRTCRRPGGTVALTQPSSAIFFADLAEPVIVAPTDARSTPHAALRLNDRSAVTSPPNDRPVRRRFSRVFARNSRNQIPRWTRPAIC